MLSHLSPDGWLLFPLFCVKSTGDRSVNLSEKERRLIMIIRKTLLVLLGFVLCIPRIVQAGDAPGRNPIQHLQQQIDELREQNKVTRDAISITIGRQQQELRKIMNCFTVEGEEVCIPVIEDKFVFVTSETYTGNLGGLQGADAKCQQLAINAGLPGVYKAWLSDNFASPSTRFNKAAVNYKLVNGVVIADSWGDLIDGNLHYAIQIDENGNILSGEWPLTKVWTGTDYDGTSFPEYCCNDWEEFCYQWTQEVPSEGARFGQYNSDNTSWSRGVTDPCNEENHLYCFQQ
jgi:hypothetical protein